MSLLSCWISRLNIIYKLSPYFKEKTTSPLQRPVWSVKEITAIYSKNHTGRINSLHSMGKMQSHWTVHTITTGLSRVKVDTVATIFSFFRILLNNPVLLRLWTYGTPRITETHICWTCFIYLLIILRLPASAREKPVIFKGADSFKMQPPLNSCSSIVVT
jgi:hypothetical protein